MLDLSMVDLGDIAVALDDHSCEGGWWIDADTGEVWYWSGELDDDADYAPEARRDARFIEPLPSFVGYGDMEDFIARVPHRRTADTLQRAITGRGAFRRFKDALFELPELREAWFSFQERRMRRRAIEFLVDEGLVGDASADRVLDELEDAPLDEGGVPADPHQVAAAVAADLRQLYGERLVTVVLYGSQARGDAHPDSDIDLAVVLDEVISPWKELRTMDDVLWRHSVSSGVTITATPISRATWVEASRPLLRAAKAEGIRVG